MLFRSTCIWRVRAKQAQFPDWSTLANDQCVLEFDHLRVCHGSLALSLLSSGMYSPEAETSRLNTSHAKPEQKAVLCSMISVVAYTLVEECPHDLLFFFRLRGWTELVLMVLIFTTTIFYSLELGMAMGVGLSVIILIRHATQPRIQILGKVSGTQARFDNAELHAENVELVEGALIVKIPEPLTFANTGDLKNRLRRLELYGSNHAHPSLPRMRAPEHNKNIIFDVHGVTSIDGSGTQVLSEIVHAYAEQKVRVFFCRLPNRNVFSMFERSGIVEKCGGLTHFVPSVDEALRLAETEDQTQEI